MRLLITALILISSQTFAVECNEIAESIKINILNKSMNQNQINSLDDKIGERHKAEALTRKQLSDLKANFDLKTKNSISNDLRKMNLEISIISSETQRRSLEKEKSNLEFNQKSLERNNELLEDIYESNCVK